MTVESVTKKGRNIILLLSSGEDIIIPYDVYLKNFFSKGDDISEDQKNKIESESETYRIKQSCFRYLSGRNHSRFELRTKLLRKKYNAGQIDKALDEMENSGIINDVSFALDYLRIKLNKNIGPLKIKSELMKKGVNLEAIDSAFDEEYDEDILMERGLKIARKKFVSLIHRKTEKKKLKQKMYLFMMGKGYPPDIVNTILNNSEFNDVQG